MPQRKQLAKKPPKRNRATKGGLTAEKLLARKVPKGVVTAAEAIKDPNSGLSKAVARLGQQITANFEALMGPLRLMESMRAHVEATRRDLDEIAADCLRPDGTLNRARFESKARVHLGLQSEEMWAMPWSHIVEDLRTVARDHGKQAQEIATCILARCYTENGPAVLDHQPEKIGVRICRLRKQRKWTQPVLGQQLGVSKRTVSRWERGDCTPTALNQNCLADLFGIPLEALVNGGPASKMSLLSP